MYWKYVAAIFLCVTAVISTTRPASAQTVDPIFLSPGIEIQPFVHAAPEGQAFVFECGVYREQTIIPRDGQSFDGQNCAELNGARILTGWQFDGTYWTVRGLPDAKSFHGECADGTDLCKYREDLFIDGVLYERVATLAELFPGTMYREGNTIFLLDDPRGREVELGLTSFAFTGSAQDVTIRDIVVTHYANDSQGGAINARAASGWQIINVTAIWNHGGGLDVGPGFRVTGGTFSDNGQIGIVGRGMDIVIDGVEIARNNYARYSSGWEAGATKFVWTDRLIVRNSCVYDNIGPGLWTDINNINTLYEDNFVFGNSSSGIKHEISYAAIIRRNTVADNGWSSGGWLFGAGIMVQNSPDVEVYDNFVQVHRDYGVGITIAHQNRGSGAFGPYDAIRNDIHDNTTVFLGDASAPSRPGGGPIGGASGMGLDVALQDFFILNRWEDNEYVIPPNRENMAILAVEGGWQTWAYVQQNTQLERRGILTLEQRQSIALECPPELVPNPDPEPDPEPVPNPDPEPDPEPQLDSEAPNVQIRSPSDGDTLYQNSSVRIEVDATDNDRIKRVELQIDGKNVVTFIGDGPYSFNWLVKHKTGKHLILARVQDQAGNRTEVSISVKIKPYHKVHRRSGSTDAS